jgi:transposase
MGRSKYPAELRERAVRMVAEVRASYGSEWAAIEAVATKLGIGTAETLRSWVRQAEVDAGARVGVSSEEHAEIKRLKRELAELRRANEILKAASVFFASNSTGHRNAGDVHRRAQGSSRGRWPGMGC